MKPKIQIQFFAYYLLLSVIPLLALSYFSYSNIITNTQKDLMNSITIDMRQSQTALDTLYGKFQKYTDIISNSTTFYYTVMDIAKDIRSGDFLHAKFNGTFNIDPQIKSLMVTDDDIAAAMVIVQGRVVYNYRDFVSITHDLSSDPVIQKTESTPNMLWFGRQTNPFGLFEGEYAVITRNVYDIIGNNPTTVICQIVLLVKQERVTGLLNNHLRFSDSLIRVMDKSGSLIGSSGTLAQDEQLGEIISKAVSVPGADRSPDPEYIQNYLVLRDFSSLSNWNIILLSPASHITKVSSSIIFFTVILIIGLLLMMILFSFIISKEIILPIKHLAHAMKKVGTKNFKITVPQKTKNEIGEISIGFNQMVKRIENLFKLTLDIERKKRKYEMDMLKYQINPHFLYNTINSIRFSAMNHNDTITADMLVTLSRLLRNTLNHTDHVIQLDQEMQNIKDYISLQQLRYDHNLNVEFHVGEATQKLYVPHMILQPIVENSIMHGLNQKLNSGAFANIIISSYLQDNSMHIISVYDNGTGMRSEVMEHILECGGSSVSGTQHIGIINIHKRIRLQYGEAYGIELDSAAGEYSNVRIKLPAVRTKEEIPPISFEILES